MIKEAALLNAAIQQGLVSTERVSEIKQEARRKREDVLNLLTFEERIPLTTLYRAYAELYHIPFVSSKQLNIHKELAKKLPRSLIEKRLIIPIITDDDEVLLVVPDPDDKASIEHAKRILDRNMQIGLAYPEELQHVIDRFIERPSMLGTENTEAGFDPVAILDEILLQAYLYRASDIHLEPLKDTLQVRLRIDGQLQHYPFTFKADEGLSIMSRMKVLASMDISEQRIAQDGSFTHTLAENKAFDIRAATMPTRFGERATLRILGSDTESLTLARIGMSESNMKRFKEAINTPYGMVLLTGPTGSGKSTTLYGALREIDYHKTNVLTVEDPIEYVMPGIAQTQVSTKVSFANALRGFLRHDPDVIMVGEIRDGETADIAVKAAMTGHLVFSTLHTNSAVSAISRLEDIGVERYLIGSTLLCVIAQRLVRKLCDSCKHPRPASVEEKNLLAIATDSATEIYDPKGCAHCMGTGYSGRTALFETLWIDEKVADKIQARVSEADIINSAKDYHSLRDDGIDKVLQGITSLEEIQRLGLCNSSSLSITEGAA